MAARPPLDRPLTMREYYAEPSVRSRIREYCGGTATEPPTAVYVAALDPHAAMPRWDTAPRLPVGELESALSAGHDVSRSLWDRTHLIFCLELDYQNTDAAAEPFLHPADVLYKLEPAYRAATSTFRALHLQARGVVTGHGYHFTGQISLDDPLVDGIASLLPTTPAWYAGYSTRRPPGVTVNMTARQARAAGGLGCLLEFAAHLILQKSADSPVPVVLNGTAVGRTSPIGRECVSIDLSHAGDPLDVRHLRVAFGGYQWHRARPDIFGTAGASVEPWATLPRGRRSLATLITKGRTLNTAIRAAGVSRTNLPNVAEGVRRLLDAYLGSSLAQAHHRFYSDLAASPSDLRPLEWDKLPACLGRSLLHPNDLLLKPEHIQHVVRLLMSRKWSPAEIARLIRHVYETDHAWGDRWQRHMDTATRAEFDVRVFSSLIVTGLDPLVDLNCVSAQEKDLCPRTNCPFDLRRERERLRAAQS